MNSSGIEEEVRQALGQVIDPETGLSIMRMELIHNIEANPDGSVSLIFRPSSPVCPLAYSLANSVKKKVEAIKHVKSVKITVENFERAEHLEGLLNSAETSSYRKDD
ncbi:MAG: iron-sulfur cluster assembly protein [Desulfomonilaceae bacterium]